MNTRKHLIIYFLFITFTLFSTTVFAASEAEEALKNDIYESFGIKVYDEDCSYGPSWSKTYLNAMILVFRDVPEKFLSSTRMVYLTPTNEQFEIKYNGYNEEYGIIQVGYGAFLQSPVYVNQFKKIYGKTPTEKDKINHFKTMLVRGMAYAFIQDNTDAYGRSGLIDSYKSVYALNPSFSTKIYNIADENYMVVAPGKNHLWTDLAFAVAQYCTNASGLKSKYPERYEFVKENIFGGSGVDGWPEKYLDGTGQTSGGDGHTGDYNGTITDVEIDTSIETETTTSTDTATSTGTNSETDTDTDTTTVTSTNTNTNTNTGTNSEVSVEDRTDIPTIPNEDYLPVVSQVDVGSIGLDSSMMTMPSGMKKAIKELFKELPKYFSTCTVGVSYMPTLDTCDAFAQEGYVFVTNNSWYAPSFTNLDDTTRAKRFKEILLREMTKCFLYYHGSRITQWRGAFGSEISNEDAKTDIVESTVLYYTDPEYLKKLSNPKELKWSFIKNNIFSNGNNPTETQTETKTETKTETQTQTETETNTNTNTGTDTGTETTEQKCFAMQDKITQAVVKYNKDNNDEMENLELQKLIDKKYLDTDPKTVLPSCEYRSRGNLTENGYIECKTHGRSTNKPSTDTGTSTSTNTGEEPYEGDLTVKVTVKNATNSTLKIGRPSDNMAVGFQIYGDYKDGSGGKGYIRLKGYFSGDHTIPAGGSSTGILSFEEKTYGKFNGYPFCTAQQVKGGVPSNAAIYKEDGSSYCCEEMLTGKFINGHHYTITFNNGPIIP